MLVSSKEEEVCGLNPRKSLLSAILEDLKSPHIKFISKFMTIANKS